MYKAMVLGLITIILLLMLATLAYGDVVPEFYETGVGDKTNTVLEVNCGSKQFQLVIKKVELDKRENDIIKWFDDVIIKCGGK